MATVNGKTLKAEHITALTKATQIHNRFYKNRDASFVEITEEEYLEQLIQKQLEGLMQGVELEKAFDEDRLKKLNAAKIRLGL